MFLYGSWGRRFLEFGKEFRQVHQNCILCVRRRFLSEPFFLWTFFEFLHCFPTVRRIICNIGAKVLENVSKLYSTGTTKLFEENLFSRENTYFYNFFEFWSKTLRTSLGKPSARFQKLPSTLVSWIFRLNVSFFPRKFTLTNGLWGKEFGFR